MDILTLSLAANKAIKTLEESGQVGRVEFSRTVVFPESTVQYSEETGGMLLPNCVLVEGTEYAVTVNGKTYRITATPYEDVNTGVHIIELIKPSDPGSEWWEIIYIPSMGICGLEMSEGVESATISIYLADETETIHPIDPKFLPGVCLPVVEITSLIAGSVEPNKLSDAESAVFQNARENKLPVICKLNLLEISLAIFMSYTGLGDVSAFIVKSPLDGGEIIVTNETGEWCLRSGEGA